MRGWRGRGEKIEKKGEGEEESKSEKIDYHIDF